MSSNRRVLVEGRDDKYVFQNLCNKYGVPPEEYEVEVKDGIAPLLDELPAYLQASNPSYLGIVADANSAPIDRWRSIRHILLEGGYPATPQHLPAEGVVLWSDRPERPRVGVWLMPNNVGPGAIEEFIQSIIHEDDKMWARTEKYVNDIPRSERLFCTDCMSKTAEECEICSHRKKACIHAWLAVQNEPGKPLGVAVKIGYLNSNAIVAQAFMRWVFDLFEFPSQRAAGDATAFRYKSE